MNIKTWIANSFDDMIEFDLGPLPVTHVQPPRALLGLIVGVVPAVVGIPMIVDALRDCLATPDNWLMLLFAMFFTALVIGALVVGLWLLTGRTITRLDLETVSQEKVWCLGRRTWSEPLRNYKGVVYRSEYHAGSRNSPSYTLYIVELHHANPGKRVKLRQSRTEAGVRGLWAESCRLLGLPALEKVGEDLVEHEAGDLGKSVRERAREGRLVVAFDPTTHPPPGLAVAVRGATLRVAINNGFWLARPGLDVGRDSIRYYRRMPWGESHGKVWKTDAIEDVRICKPVGERRDAVQLCSNDGTMSFGQGLSREGLEWLKNCVLAVVTR